MNLDLADRYGTGRNGRRTLLIVVSTVIGVLALGWLAWVIWDDSNPDVTSELRGWRVVDQHQGTATVDVQLKDGVEATCRLRALASDHSVVGEVNFAPVAGANEVTIRTDREAVQIDLVGCTAPDQNRPR